MNPSIGGITRLSYQKLLDEGIFADIPEVGNSGDRLIR